MNANDKLIADVRIAQHIGQAHREAFRIKYPGQIEHCLRLTAERLQKGLDKNATQQLDTQEVADLAQALCHLHKIYTYHNEQSITTGP